MSLIALSIALSYFFFFSCFFHSLRIRRHSFWHVESRAAELRKSQTRQFPFRSWYFERKSPRLVSSFRTDALRNSSCKDEDHIDLFLKGYFKRCYRPRRNSLFSFEGCALSSLSLVRDRQFSKPAIYLVGRYWSFWEVVNLLRPHWAPLRALIPVRKSESAWDRVIYSQPLDKRLVSGMV